MFVIVANVAAADSVLRLGAKVVIEEVNGDPSHVRVRGCSRSGRVISKFLPLKRLTNLRPKWDHETESWHKFETREQATEYIAARLAGHG
jgi:hypothetical protein